MAANWSRLLPVDYLWIDARRDAIFGPAMRLCGFFGVLAFAPFVVSMSAGKAFAAKKVLTPGEKIHFVKETFPKSPTDIPKSVQEVLYKLHSGFNPGRPRKFRAESGDAWGWVFPMNPIGPTHSIERPRYSRTMNNRTIASRSAVSPLDVHRDYMAKIYLPWQVDNAMEDTIERVVSYAYRLTRRGMYGLTPNFSFIGIEVRFEDGTKERKRAPKDFSLNGRS